MTKLAAALGLLVALFFAALGTRDTPTDLDAAALITLDGRWHAVSLPQAGTVLRDQWRLLGDALLEG